MKTRILAALLAATFAVSCTTTPEPKPDDTTTQAPPAPAAEAGPPESPEPWRKERPAPSGTTELVIPTFKKTTLKNGLTVLVSERHDLPMVSMSIALAAGTAQDPKGKAGLADLTHTTLLEGAGKRDAIAIDEAFADLGGAPFVFARPDGAMVGTRVLTRNAPQALELLADIVMRPAFKKEDFERKKKEHLNSLAGMVGNPRWLAQWAVTSTLFGPDHPYGQLGSGTTETVKALDVKDAKAFWQTWSGPKAAALVVTGDVTLEQAKAWGEKYFGAWKGKGTRPPLPPEVKPDTNRQVIVVPKAALEQTIVIAGRPAIESGHPDEAALELASTVFGGFFGSRLNMQLREAKGYSYGAYAYVDARRGEGPLIASSQVKADVTGPSVEEFIKLMDGLKTKPITEQELSAARDGLIQSLPGTFSTVEDLNRAAAGLFWEDKALDHFTKLVEKLQGATPEQVQAAAEKYLDPTTVDLILVGDPTLIRAQVEPLNLGEFIVKDPPTSNVAAAPGASPGAAK